MAKKNNSLETTIIQLQSLFPNKINKINDLSDEYKISQSLKKTINAPLYRLLHITRIFDTCLNLYLDSIGELRDQHSLGSYLIQLSKSTSKHSALNGGLKQRYQKEIVDERNKYMHTAGTIPTKKVVKNASERIYECLQVVMANHII